MIKGYIWDQNGKRVYDKNTDKSAGGMYNVATIKGVIATIPNVPGLAVWTDGHIGVYIGDGKVVEARGFDYGVVETEVFKRTWTHWLAIPYISYAGYEELLNNQKFDEPYQATVSTQNSDLNIWDTPKKSKSLLRVPKGESLMVTDFVTGYPGWYQVEKSGIKGVVDGQYLRRKPIEEITDDSGDTGKEVIDPGPNPTVLYQSQVVDVASGLNLRIDPSKTSNNTIILIPPQAIVDVLNPDVGNGFAFVCYGKTLGYCTNSYLKRIPEMGIEHLYDVECKRVSIEVASYIRDICPGAIIKNSN